MHDAAQKGAIAVARLLLAAGARVNAVDDRGRTPLAYCEPYGKPEVAELLKKHGGR